MKVSHKVLQCLGSVSFFCGLFGGSVAFAVPLNNVHGLPQFTGTNLDIVYDYTKSKLNGQNQTPGGILTITDNNAVGGGSGIFKFTFDNIRLEGFSADYSLSANFDADGDFVDGNFQTTLSSGIASIGSATGDVLISADLTDFGFGGTGITGLVDYEFTYVTGVLAGYGDTGGVVASLESLTAGAPTRGWDLDADFFRDWSGATGINTYVPLPAAIWMFMAGLTIIAGSQSRKAGLNHKK